VRLYVDKEHENFSKYVYGPIWNASRIGDQDPIHSPNNLLNKVYGSVPMSQVDPKVVRELLVLVEEITSD